MSLCRMNWTLLWQLALSCSMLGLEGCSMLLCTMMVVNIQTLGAPIAYCSISGVISACTSVTLITAFGFVMNRWGKTRNSKAKTFGLTSGLPILGVIFIIIANACELIKEKSMQNSVFVDSNLNIDIDNISLSASLATPVWEYMASMNKTLPAPATSIPGESAHHSHHNTTYAYAINMNGSLEVTMEYMSEGDDPVPWIAYLVMAGYTLVDCGYDVVTCFLKTFILDCSPQEFHSSVLIKLLLVGSVGGILVTGLGSSDIGATLTSGTGLDANALMCCALAALCLAFLVVGTCTTLLMGLLWKVPTLVQPNTSDVEQKDIPTNNDEKSPLKNEISSSSKPIPLQKNQTPQHSSLNGTLTNGTKTSNGESNLLHPLPPETSNSYERLDHIEHSDKNFVQRNKTLILINILSFLLNSALFVFAMFSANFLGEAVFKGDPAAPKSSPEYQAYLQGVSVAARGFFITYITSTIANGLHEKLLAMIGWKLETIIATVVHCGLCIGMGLTLNVWVFYVGCCWFALYRTIGLSVPYILADKNSGEQSHGDHSSAAIASVSAMYPLCILVCSPLVSPLIAITGNAATGVYYTATCGLLACLLIPMIKVKAKQ